MAQKADDVILSVKFQLKRMIKIYTNIKTSSGLLGGANSFLRALFESLKRKGVDFTNNIHEKHDLVFLNALTTDGSLKRRNQITFMSEKDVSFIREKSNAPIVHRKVNFKVSGPPEMRKADENGYIYGDLRQISFSQYIDHTIFQSKYSHDVFTSSGFRGNYNIIMNGVDTSNFNRQVNKISIHNILGYKQYPHWSPSMKKMRLVMVSWSRDFLKGFDKLLLLDNYLEDNDQLSIYFVGRLPSSFVLKNVRINCPIST